tara:strand:+ start:85 stop:324 length:240 start_codon:yes stop_codon:yes gene_type:complete
LSKRATLPVGEDVSIPNINIASHWRRVDGAEQSIVLRRSTIFNLKIGDAMVKVNEKSGLLIFLFIENLLFNINNLWSKT